VTVGIIQRFRAAGNCRNSAVFAQFEQKLEPRTPAPCESFNFRLSLVWIVARSQQSRQAFLTEDASTGPGRDELRSFRASLAMLHAIQPRSELSASWLRNTIYCV
jgi:hypothetical protein